MRKMTLEFFLHFLIDSLHCRKHRNVIFVNIIDVQTSYNYIELESISEATMKIIYVSVLKITKIYCKICKIVLNIV